ncbi:putative MFS family arabinose efflux permease [Halanaerobium saccharolyticum]|uniref:Putative MFS family arabinose efflux permease n=2 Tax=Halanaerobium saccharolyticum TaxID=43595 RepID=A0A4R7Z3B4_9FIRM|nr:putative MFS family arabinose efflux permease [Halanaerobium saccharolyticum]TDW05410.1 putative MFS family arabinose efflux permease [Halanaerobium saccharolyticum]TDX62925.1 putative MFS family arabinose efflux permease [Halanaerobium saccharolyticum]
MRIGTLMSIRTFMGLLGPPIVGYICDRLESRKIIFIISMVLMAIFVAPLTFYGDLMLAISIGVVGFLWEPQQSVLDSWILETSAHTAHNYGFMRAWGSIGFAIIVTVFGQIIERFGWRVHFLGYGIIAFIVVIIAFNIKDNSYSELQQKKESETAVENKKQNKNISPEDRELAAAKEVEVELEDKNIMRLFKNPDYIFILFITLLIFIPNQMLFVYLAPIIRSVGGNSTDLGYTLFFNALSEAPIFFVAKYFLEKYKTNSLLLFSAFFYLLRFIIAAAATSPVYFLFFGMLQSLSFGVFLVTVRYYVKLVAPPALKTTAQSIAMMSAFGAAGIIGSLLGGYLIDNYGMAVMFRVGISLALIAVLVLAYVVIRERKSLEKTD